MDLKAALAVVFILMLAGGLMLSCKDEEYTEVIRYEELKPFHAVELNSVFDVFLIQDQGYALEIAADESIVDNITFSLEDGLLKVENTSKIKWFNPETNKVKLYIRANKLAELFPNETCKIKSVNPIISDEFRVIMGHNPKLAELDLELQTGSFYYWNNHQCGGRLTLRGNTGSLHAYTFGYMSVDAVGLSADYAVVENNSKGDMRVWVNHRIDCSLRGVGDIFLHGNPAEVMVHERTSEGDLIKVD